MSNPLEEPIILIPLIWLAATTLVVAACQVAARGERCRASTLGEEALDERGALDQHQAPDRIASARERSATARERGVMVHHGQ
jgi:hypothetical protein